TNYVNYVTLIAWAIGVVKAARRPSAAVRRAPRTARANRAAPPAAAGGNRPDSTHPAAANGRTQASAPCPGRQAGSCGSEPRGVPGAQRRGRGSDRNDFLSQQLPEGQC